MWIKTNTGYSNTDNVEKISYHENRGTVLEYANGFEIISNSNIVEDVIREIMLGREIMEVHF